MAEGLASTCSSKQLRTSCNGLECSRQLNDESRTSESFSPQLQTKPSEKDHDGLGVQGRAKRRSKRSSWEVNSYLRDLVWKIEFLAEELERLLSPILVELCRLAKEFEELPQPKWGSVKVRARGREYEYDVLYLSESGEFFAKKIYLNSDKRRELAARYESIYRKTSDLLRAARSYCELQASHRLELQDTAKPREEDLSSLATSIPLNEELLEDYEEEYEEDYEDE